MSPEAGGAPSPSARPALEVEDLTVRFGGVTALDRVSLRVPTGTLVGLIGPNGAGKSTLFNACAGLVTPANGTVRLFGEDVGHLGPARRAQRGLGRTFQQMELFTSMSVEENVGLGLEAGLVGASPVRQFLSRRGESDRIADAVDTALDACRLTALARRPVGALSTGHRRLVELARAYAGGFPLLLLDEPSSGLDDSETAHFADVIRSMVAERGTAILLVEHDMALVMRVCSDIFVLDFGELIFQGTPPEVRTSPVVRSAYLGTQAGLETAEHRAEAT
jgi:ABC-type branched-subunit amino acid transport system ATPase component